MNTQNKQQKLMQDHRWKKNTSEDQLIFQELTDEELDLVAAGHWFRSLWKQIIHCWRRN
ncbi:hypothetical protein ACP6PL_14595 [Dapis sp. BLCC M126]|uniref:hypothetical protein n=1 Tax=Dapis sp. BLCC M126 TaxID=3400189 RepID=UPI003CEA8627